MTMLEGVRRTQRWLALSLGLRSAIWAAAASVAVLAAGAALGVVYPIPTPYRTAVTWLAALIAAVVLGCLAWRARFVASPTRVALWIEERAPELRYALVTAVEPRYADTLAPQLAPVLAKLRPERFARATLARSLWPPLALLGTALLVLGLLPPALAAPPAGGAPVPGSSGTTAEMPNRLTPLRATITPPAYAAAVGIPPTQLDDPVTVAALAGSEVVLHGHGSPTGIEAALGDSALVVTTAGEEGWSISFTLSAEPGLVRLQDREYQRLLVLAPEPDNAPRAQLISPARDTTLRTAEGRLVLEARLRDDLGLRDAWFEYIVSSGEGEGNYSFREGRLGERVLAGVREAVLRLTVPLADFDLGPGDRLSVRAATRDNNTWNGPGIGYSETRLLRLARPSEYDSLAVSGAPPAVDSTLMTLRYLILLTEELHDAREVMVRKVYVDSSIALGRRAELLRDRVQVLQDDQTLGGLFERNPLLDTGYIALAQGAAALRVGEPGIALPHLREALRVLTEYARAERYYTHGGTPDILVDLARVRLAGRDTGHATPRPAREMTDQERLRLRALYADAVRALSTDREGAIGQLLELQADALRLQPALAAVLGSAIAELRSGRDAAPLLWRARLLLEGRTATVDTLPRWGGVW